MVLFIIFVFWKVLVFNKWLVICLVIYISGVLFSRVLFKLVKRLVVLGLEVVMYMFVLCVMWV